MIQIFIRVVFRRIWWQEKRFNLLVLFLSDSNKLAMMDLQVIRNQEDLLFRRTKQLLHKSIAVGSWHPEWTKKWALSWLLMAEIILTRCRFVSTGSSGGRSSGEKPTTLHQFVAAYTRLVRPIDNRLFCFRSFYNYRIFLDFPPLDAFGILFPYTLRRTLQLIPQRFISFDLRSIYSISIS